jgi:transcriptional regulator with XRE-family HTH domain
MVLPFSQQERRGMMARRTQKSCQDLIERARIGSRIKYQRQKSGLSLRKVAALTEMSASTLCRLEAGICLLSVNRLLTLTRVLGCDPAEVLGKPSNDLPTNGQEHPHA